MAAETHPESVLDTGQQYLGSVYAKALLGASQQAGQTDPVLEQLDSVVDDVLARMPQFEATLSSPRIASEVKERLLDQAFQGKMVAELLNFLKVLSRRGRFDCLRAIRRAFRQQYNDLRGRVAVEVRSADALDSATEEAIITQLQAVLGQEVELRLQVDSKLIAGIVVRVGDTVYDGSVLNRLSQMRQALVSKATQTIRSDMERFAVSS